MVPSTRTLLRIVLPGLLPFALILGSAPASSPAASSPISLRVTELGKPGEPAPLPPESDGSYRITGTGRESNMGTDQATFAGIQTSAPNFTFIARVAQVENAGQAPKYGITARAGLSGRDRAVQVRYDGYAGHQCLQWFHRYLVAPGDPDGGRRCFHAGIEKEMRATEAFWLKIVRTYPYVRTYSSTDGETWSEVGADQSKALLPATVWVGLQVTGGTDSNSPARIRFDQVRFTEDPNPASADMPATLREYHPEVPAHRLYFTTVTDSKGEDPATMFVLLPEKGPPPNLRALFWSTGSKEFLVHGQPYAWRKATGNIRIPPSFESTDPHPHGSVVVDGLDPLYLAFTHYGLVHVGGYFKPDRFADGIRRLAELTGIPQLADLPFVATGASFAGGYAAQAAARYPEKTIASAPVIIGMAGSDTEQPEVLAVPHLHVFGTTDTVHLKTALETTPKLRARGALWANAPMWMVAHRQHKADALIYPYFADLLDLRLPASADAGTPASLRALNEEAGWFGLTGSWNGNAPEIAPVRGFTGDRSGCVWLPNEHTARVWQAFASNNPRTVIHFPTFDGTNTFGGPQPWDWRVSQMEAGTPWELVATGPLGEGVAVEFYAGLRKLKTTRRDPANPYRVTVEPLPPGWHAIHAITTVGGVREISRPVTVFFHARPGGQKPTP